MRRLVGALLLFTWAVSACSGGRATPTAPADLVAEGWQAVRLESLCVEVEQSFAEIDPGFSLPVEDTLRRLLPGLGVRVAAGDEACDGVLHLSLQGQALAEDYICILGQACGHCYTGAQVDGELTLTSSDGTSWVGTLSDSITPPSTISECPEVPEDAPLDMVWPRAVLDGLVDLWGTPVLAVALDDQDESVRMAAVALSYRQGAEGVPLLVEALQDRSADVRQRAAVTLGRLGAEGSEAVPALIEALDDSNRPVRQAVSGALFQITGQRFGEDQAAWRAWLEEPSLEPTPFTSWKGLPIMPGASFGEELGSMLMYVVEASCEEVESFYQAEMAEAGWTTVDGETAGGAVPRLKFEKGGETAEVHFTDSTMMTGQPRCSLQVFLLR